MKRTITIEKFTNPETKERYKAIFIDGQVFDWHIDRKSLVEAKRFAQNDPVMKQSIYTDIQSHFMHSFCEFIGKKITLEELNEALMTGRINC